MPSPASAAPRIGLRAFAPSDAAAVNALALAAFAQYRNVYQDWELLERGVGAMAALAETAEIVVGENEAGALVGAVAYVGPFSVPRADFFAAEWPIIRMLVVHPASRGAGIGRRLTEACVDRGRRDGAKTIALHTSPAMATALALYLRMGFVLDRHVPDRFGVPYAVYLKDLSPA